MCYLHREGELYVSEHVEYRGQFWVSTIGSQKGGTLNLEAGAGKPRLSVVGPIFEERAIIRTVTPGGGLAITHTGDPADSVADFQPLTILGETGEGRKLTLLDAVGGGSPFGGLGQSFEAIFAVDGDHVEPDQVYSHARYALDSRWIRGLCGTEQPFKALDGGSFKIYEESGHIWIEFFVRRGGRIREFENLLLLPVMTLARMTLGTSLELSASQVRIRGDSAWLNLYSARSKRHAEDDQLPAVFHPSDVTIQHLAEWIGVSERAEGLVDAVAAFDYSGPIETQVITLTAVAEGVHRKLFRKSVAFPELERLELRAVRRAGKAAMASELERLDITDPERINQLDDTLAQIGDIRYRARLGELAKTVESAAPEIFRSFQDWTKAVAEARNKNIHQLDDEDAEKLTPAERYARHEQLLDLMLAVKFSVPWVLKLTFLRLAGFAAEEIAEKLAEYRPYMFDLEHIAIYMARHPYRRIVAADVTEI